MEKKNTQINKTQLLPSRDNLATEDEGWGNKNKVAKLGSRTLPLLNHGLSQSLVFGFGSSIFG